MSDVKEALCPGCGVRESLSRRGLRDWFAVAVLEGMLASGRHEDDSDRNLAEAAYTLADAMLTERDRRNKEE